MVAGANTNDSSGTNTGRAYVFGAEASGGVASVANLIVYGYANSTYLGTWVDGVGDTDADGLDDVIIGAPYSDYGATDGGEANLFLGGASGTLPSSSAEMLRLS